MVNENGLYPHHRRPTSLNGHKTKSYNISRVEKSNHDIWHKLYGNMNAYQIAIQMTLDFWMFKYTRIVIICKYINSIEEVELFGGGGTKNFKYRSFLFLQLLRNKSVPDFINEINSKWLDSAYHFHPKFFKKVPKKKK